MTVAVRYHTETEKDGRNVQAETYSLDINELMAYATGWLQSYYTTSKDAYLKQLKLLEVGFENSFSNFYLTLDK